MKIRTDLDNAALRQVRSLVGAYGGYSFTNALRRTVNPMPFFRRVTGASFVSPHGLNTVHITEGCVMVTDVGSLDLTDPVPDAVWQQLLDTGNPQPAATTLTVADGDTVWMLLTYDGTDYGSGAVQCRVYECVGAEYVAEASPTPSSSEAYVPLAHVAVDGAGNVRLTRVHTGGPIEAPSLVFPIEGEAEEPFTAYFSCSVTGTDEITVAAGRYNYDITSLASIPALFQTASQDTTAAVMSSLAANDFIWIEIERSLNYEDHTPVSIDSVNYQLKRYTHYHNTSLGDTYVINSGPTVPAPTGAELIVPLCQYVSGEVKQLHIGVIIVPAMFASSFHTT